MTKFRGLFASVVMCTSLAYSQTGKPSEVSTKLQAFEAKTGTVVIEGFTNIGSVRGDLGGDISIEAVELIDATSGTKQFGIKIDVAKGDEIGTESISWVDTDEIDSLLKGIDYVSKVDSSATKMNQFQADYRTRDDLRISAFSETNGNIGIAVESGELRAARVFFKQDGLSKVRNLIVQAQDAINSAR